MRWKESIVLLPVFVIIAGRITEADRSRRSLLRRADIYWLVALAVVISLRLIALGTQAVPLFGKTSVAFDYPWSARLSLFVTSLGESVRMLLWPTGQASYYGHLRDQIFGTPYTPLLWIAIGVVALMLLDRFAETRLVWLGSTWLVLALLPVVNLLPIGTAFADRFLYWPTVGVAILAASVVEKLFVHKWRRAAFALLSLVLILSITLSARVCVHWRTPLSHWQWIVEHHPRSPKSHALVAWYLIETLDETGLDSQARLDQAKSHVDIALELNEFSPDAWRARAMIYLIRKQHAAALDAIESAIRLRPGDATLIRTRQRIADEITSK